MNKFLLLFFVGLGCLLVAECAKRPKTLTFCDYFSECSYLLIVLFVYVYVIYKVYLGWLLNGCCDFMFFGSGKGLFWCWSCIAFIWIHKWKIFFLRSSRIKNLYSKDLFIGAEVMATTWSNFHFMKQTSTTYFKMWFLC